MYEEFPLKESQLTSRRSSGEAFRNTPLSSRFPPSALKDAGR